MSTYYNINGLKVRISDHQANTSLNGSSDIYLYIKSADNSLLSIHAQVERICEKRDLDITSFKEILNEWKDGSYSMDFFKESEADDLEDETPSGAIWEMKQKAYESNDKSLKGHVFTNKQGQELRAEIKQLSATTGISQSFIKKYLT